MVINIDLGILLASVTSEKEYRKPKLTINFRQKVTVRQLITHLGIPENYISFVTVNGDKCDWDTVLEYDADIILFPPIAGG